MQLIVLQNIAIHSCYIGSKVVLALLALEFGATPLVIGLLISCYALLPMALGVFVGRLADTAGMRAPMLIGAVFMGAAMLTGYLWQAFAALFVTAVLAGAGFVFFNISIQNLTGAISRPDGRARNYSTLSVSYSVSTFLGPVIAGYSIEFASHGTAFLVFALFTLFPIAVQTLHGANAKAATSSPAGAERSAFDLLRNPPLRRVILVSGLIAAAWDLNIFYVPVFGHSVGLPASAIGNLLGAFAVATFLIRFAIPIIMKKLRIDQMLMISMLIAACAFLVFPFLRSAYALMVASFVIGLGLGCGQPLSMTLAYERSPAGRSGEVTGLRLIANNVTRVAVPMLCGAIGTAFGTTPVFWMNALNLAAVSYLSRK